MELKDEGARGISGAFLYIQIFDLSNCHVAVCKALRRILNCCFLKVFNNFEIFTCPRSHPHP